MNDNLQNARLIGVVLLTKATAALQEEIDSELNIKDPEQENKDKDDATTNNGTRDKKDGN